MLQFYEEYIDLYLTKSFVIVPRNIDIATRHCFKGSKDLTR